MKRYFAGIDAGGTKTTILIADENENIILSLSSNSANFYGVGYETAKSNLKELFDEVKKRTGIDQFESVFIGMSSFYKPPDSVFTKDFTDFIKAKSINIDSDLRIALECMKNKNGVMVISGTGSMIVHIDRDSRLHTVGGYGHLIGDEGSAYHMAVEGLKAAIRDYEGWGEKTLLTDKVREFYKIDDIHDLINIVHKPDLLKHEIADFAKYIDICASHGDKVSEVILKTEGEYLFNQLMALIRKIEYVPQEIGYYGGVLMNSRITRETFIQSIYNEFGDKTVIYPIEKPPEYGALKLSYKYAANER